MNRAGRNSTPSIEGHEDDFEQLLRQELVRLLIEMGISVDALPFADDNYTDLIVNTTIERLGEYGYVVEPEDIIRVLESLSDSDIDVDGSGKDHEPIDQPPSSNEGEVVADGSVDTAGTF